MWTVFWPFLTPTPSSPMWTEVDFQHTHPKSHPMKICLNYNFFRINKTKNNGYGIKELFIKVIFPCSKGTFFSIVHILDILIHTWSMCTQGRRNRWNRWSTCFTGNQRLSKLKQSNRQEKKYVGYYFFLSASPEIILFLRPWKQVFFSNSKKSLDIIAIT